MKKTFWLIPVIALYLLVNIPGLFVPMVVNAAKYAQVGREILANHDWINLTIGGDGYDQKPPLLFWIAAVVFHFFGISGVAYKIAVILVSWIGIYATYKLGNVLYDKRTGILSAMFWATCLAYVHFHDDIHTDSMLVVPVMLSIWQYAAYFKYRKEYQFYLGTIFVGVAMLSKGPVGMLVPGAAVGIHLLFTRDFKAILNYRWLLAVPIVAVLILPALWGLFDQFGWEGIKFYFWTNNMGRVTGTYHGNNTDPFFYIHTTLYTAAPWTVFVFAGFFMQLQEKFRKKGNSYDTSEFYTLGGTIVYLLISSVAKAKNPHYEMAVLPLMMIIAARWTFLIFEKESLQKVKKVISSINLVVACLAFFFAFPFLFYIFPESRFWVWLIIALLAVAFAYSFKLKDPLYKQLAGLLVGMSAILFTLNVNILPNMVRYHSTFEACRIFNREAAKSSKLHIFTEEGRYWDIFFYSKNYGRYLVTEDDYRRFDPPANDWLYTGPEGVKELADMNVKVDTIKVFQHRSLSKMSLKFLNPRTRASKLEKRYLLRIKEN